MKLSSLHDWKFVVTPGPVVHAVVDMVLACGGRFAISQVAQARTGAHVTCFWCIAGAQAPELRWYFWANEMAKMENVALLAAFREDIQ